MNDTNQHQENNKKEENDIELTRLLEAKKSEKKKSKTKLFLTLGTVTLIAGGAVGLVYVIDKANKTDV